MNVITFAVIAVPVEPAPPPLLTSYHSDDSSDNVYDYTERRALPISIPDHQSIDTGSDKFVVSTGGGGGEECDNKFKFKKT